MTEDVDGTCRVTTFGRSQVRENLTQYTVTEAPLVEVQTMTTFLINWGGG